MIEQRLTALREELQREQLAAFIFPTSDPHDSEYTAPRWKGREWISGFSGSAGTAVVTLHSAALWTDSRYFIAAAQQLEGSGFQLMKEGVEGTPTIAEWLNSTLTSNHSPQNSTEVAIDGSTATCSTVEQLISDLRRQGGLTLRTNLDILQRIWTDRPAVPMQPVTPQPIAYTGEDAASKLQRIRKALRGQHADGMLMARLDDIAWTLNLRGSDIPCNPVFMSYLLITTQTATLFIHDGKLTADAQRQLSTAGIATAPYTTIGDALTRYPEYNILADPDEVSYSLMQAIRAQEVVREASPVPALKAVKSQAEQEGFRHAMLRDGVAMVRFLRWLKPAVEAGGQTEMSIDSKLTALRAEQPLYEGKSFDTIAAYQAHGAIVHYEATPQTDVPLRPEGLLLLDSGAQYRDGTTDITRTIALGPVSDEQKEVYTLVLKGHIQLQLLQFPDGVSGTQLDAIARRPLWHAGLNYLHGTGHGVGSYLCVHEGPHQIRMQYRPAPIHAGMTVTDEPGVYLEGRFGVRIENTLLVQPYRETPCGRFLQFETLTLCPIDKSPILAHLLTDDERTWLDSYHQTVYERLSPLLDDEADRQWLREATLPLSQDA
ncbi:MAG: aminopeptidase P family protein [Prevotella sp.]|nr:aminopeptidase P family protein [Prevotella sp.]